MSRAEVDLQVSVKKACSTDEVPQRENMLEHVSCTLGIIRTLVHFGML